MQLRALGLFVLMGLLAVGCAGFNLGKEFPAPAKDTIRVGVTTQADIQQRFGEPTQVGIEDGDTIWTYYFVRKTPDQELSKQLYVKFTAAGVVKSYSYTSSFPEDMKRFK